MSSEEQYYSAKVFLRALTEAHQTLKYSWKRALGIVPTSKGNWTKPQSKAKTFYNQFRKSKYTGRTPK